jgi:hypothetical protein
LWPRGRGNKSQQEKGDRVAIEEDFGEAMHVSSMFAAGKTFEEGEAIFLREKMGS